MRFWKLSRAICAGFFLVLAGVTVFTVMMKNPFEDLSGFQKVISIMITFPFDWMCYFGIFWGFAFYLMFYTLIIGLLLLVIKVVSSLLYARHKLDSGDA